MIINVPGWGYVAPHGHRIHDGLYVQDSPYNIQTRNEILYYCTLLIRWRFWFALESDSNQQVLYIYNGEPRATFIKWLKEYKVH